MTSVLFDAVSRSQLIRPVEALAFWTAIALPFLYVPLLVLGLESTPELAAFLGLVVLNVISFVVGHRHTP